MKRYYVCLIEPDDSIYFEDYGLVLDDDYVASWDMKVVEHGVYVFIEMPE